jgi:hypothetical protein
MNDTKHTPGPWECRKTAGAGLQIYGNVSAALGEDFAEVVQIFDTFNHPPKFMVAYERWVQFPQREWNEMQEANARLIAAAPDLLRVAELLVSWLDEEEGSHKLCDAARAAIAAATGGDQ